MSVHTLADPVAKGGFRHEALLYAGEEAFVEATVAFIVDGLARNEPVMVAVNKRKIGLLESNLGWDGHWVDFVDMAQVGTNPGRIISVWRQFREQHRDRPSARGIGEPVWAGRSQAELIECRNHELLLNTAFDPGPPWRLMCPYDTQTLDAESLAAAERTHPLVKRDTHAEPSEPYHAHGPPPQSVLEGVLPEPEVAWEEATFGPEDRLDLRRIVMRAATQLPERRAVGLARAVDQVTDNSVRYGGGSGTLRVWRESDAVVCEVRDRGQIRDPLVGRELPPRKLGDQHGLWLVHALCDLVQLRSSEDGTVVRMTMRTIAP